MCREGSESNIIDSVRMCCGLWWNRVSQQVVSAQTIGSLKRKLDDFMDEDKK